VAGLGFGCEMLRSAPSLGTDEAERTKFGRIVRITHQSPWVRVLDPLQRAIICSDSRIGNRAIPSAVAMVSPVADLFSWPINLAQ